MQVNPKAGFVSIGNTFTADNAVQAKESALSFDNHVAAYDALQVRSESRPARCREESVP